MECLDLLIACTQFDRSVLLLGKVLSKEKRKSLPLLWKPSHSHITTYGSGTCGYAGTLNDLNILDLSPFLESPVNVVLEERRVRLENNDQLGQTEKHAKHSTRLSSIHITIDATTYVYAAIQPSLFEFIQGWRKWCKNHPCAIVVSLMLRLRTIVIQDQNEQDSHLSHAECCRCAPAHSALAANYSQPLPQV